MDPVRSASLACLGERGEQGRELVAGDLVRLGLAYFPDNVLAKAAFGVFPVPRVRAAVIVDV